MCYYHLLQFLLPCQSRILRSVLCFIAIFCCICAASQVLAQCVFRNLFRTSPARGFCFWTCCFDILGLRSVYIELRNLLTSNCLLFDMNKKKLFARYFRSRRAVQAASYFVLKNQHRKNGTYMFVFLVRHDCNLLLLSPDCVPFVLRWLPNRINTNPPKRFCF